MAAGNQADKPESVTKFCPGCKQDKPRTTFGPRRQSSDGLRPRCNRCRQIYQTAVYQANLLENRAIAAKRRRDKYRADPAAGAALAKKYREKNPRPKKPRIVLSPEESLRRKRASCKKTYENNKGKVLARAAIYRAAHRDEEHANRVAHYQRNKEHVAKVTKAYRLAHPDLYNAAFAKLRAGESMPPWADQSEILKFYTEATRLTRETGIPHEVDHIYPVKSKTSCGLHLPWNLQVLTRAENRKKANRLPED